MHLVALLSDDPEVRGAIGAYRDPAARFHLHSVPAGAMGELMRALSRLDFAGALVLDENRQLEAQRLAERSSLVAQELGAADTLTVTQAGIIADHTLGRAVTGMLTSHRWDAAGSRVVVLGSGPTAKALGRELVSLGARSLAVLAADRVAAERSLPHTHAGVELLARASADPLSGTLFESADLVVRVDGTLRVPSGSLGPHLTLIDLGSEPVSALRSQAMSLGSLTFNRRDVEAYRLELGLSQVLGGSIGVEPLLALFHAI